MAATAQIDNRRDILLLLLYAPGATGNANEPVTGRTRLVKMLFLFKNEALKHFRRGTRVNDSNFYEFFAWNFGPFSRDVYDDLTFFSLRNFIETSESEEVTLPESVAEWERWLSTTDDVSDDPAVVDYAEEDFTLTDKGVRFAKPMWDSLSNAQRTLLKEFKTRVNKVSLRALLRYVYEEYPDSTTKSTIKEKVLADD